MLEPVVVSLEDLKHCQSFGDLIGTKESDSDLSFCAVPDLGRSIWPFFSRYTNCQGFTITISSPSS